MRLRTVDYAVIAFIVAVVIYLLYKWRKSKKSKEHKEEHKQDDKEGAFEKLLKSKKESQYIIPSRYEESSQEPPVKIVTFDKEESNNIVNEWLQKFVKYYCGKTITFTLPSPFNDTAQKIMNAGMLFTILNNSSKTEEEKKDDLGMVYLLIEASGDKVKYRVLMNDTVQLMPELAYTLNTNEIISFRQFKEALYEMYTNIKKNNEEGKNWFVKIQNRFEQYKKSKDQTYEESSEEKIRNDYQRQYNEYTTKAQFYCQNI
jgi:hypothetical protein